MNQDYGPEPAEPKRRQWRMPEPWRSQFEWQESYTDKYAWYYSKGGPDGLCYNNANIWILCRPQFYYIVIRDDKRATSLGSRPWFILNDRYRTWDAVVSAVVALSRFECCEFEDSELALLSNSGTDYP
jgi:hypothetical protein